MKLEWIVAETYPGAFECAITQDCILRVEPKDGLWIAAVLSSRSAEYRSRTYCEIETAKRQAILHGARVARNKASRNTELANFLKRAYSGGDR